MSKKLTTEELVEKAKLVHGDKYDYSKVEYVNNRTKVCIICPIHGEFWQTPNDHLSRKGCKECSNNTLLTTEEWVCKALETINNIKYDYSKVEYVGAQKKVCIICKEHGEFWQTPDNHLHNHGCPKCDNKNVTTEEFIEKVIKVHGDKYDYSKVEYVNNKTKVCIMCPIHGEFCQTPSSHLNGAGCPICGNEKIREKITSNTSEFIEKSNVIHNNTYSYDKTYYINNNTKVCITCPIHGDFWQLPSSHLQGKKCKKCVGLDKTTEEWVLEANLIHNNYFDYSKTEYIDSYVKVCIICPIHGEFWQNPSNHLQGNGCPFCNESNLERKIEILLTNNNIDFEKQKRFWWLGRQSLDFYLPQYNTAVECQGIQHFKPIDFFGGEEGFEFTKIRDLDKKILCGDNHVKLLYFSELKEYDTFLGEPLIKNKEDLLKRIKNE